MEGNIHKLRHEVLENDILEIKECNKGHETRLVSLEKINSVRDEQIKNMLIGMDNTNDSIKSLINWIKWGLAFIIPSTLGLFMWLFQQQIS